VLLLALALIAFFMVSVKGSGPEKFLDAFEFYYPSYKWLYAELAAGRLPLWNPYQLCGIPTVGTLQPGLFYPPHLFYLFLPTHVAMEALGFLHLMLIGATTLYFGLRCGLSPVAGFLAALLVTTRGALPAHLSNPSMLESAAWLAVGFIGVLDLTQRRPLRGVALLGLATGMSLLAGFPQFSVYAAYAWGFFLVVLLVARRSSLSKLFGAGAALLVGVGLGALVAAVVLLPALELTDVGARERGILPLRLMLALGGIGFEKPLEALEFVLSVRPALPDVAFTFGWVGVLLVPVALAARPLRPLAVALALLGLLTIGFALGPATPLFDLYRVLPELGSFRNPWRVLFITDFCFAVAAGIGLDGLLRLVVGLWGRFKGMSDRSGGTGIRSPQGATSGKGVASVVALFIVFLALGEIFLAEGNRELLPYDSRSPLLEPYLEQRPILDVLVDSEDRAFTLFLGRMGDVSEKLSSLYRIRSVSDYEIMTLKRQQEYFSYLFWGKTSPGSLNREGHSQKIFYGYVNLLDPGIEPEAVASRNRLLEIAAARYVVTSRSGFSMPPVKTYLQEAGLQRLNLGDPMMMVFENSRSLPRAYVTHRVRPAPEVEVLLKKLADRDFDPREESYLEIDVESALPDLAPAQGEESVSIVSDTLDEVVLQVDLDAPGVVILSDSYYPGWRATVDGTPARIYAANHLFRGVEVGAGVHEVRFSYEPFSVRMGAGLSLVGVISLVALFIASRREAGRTSP